MATIINNPAEREVESTGTGVVIGILAVILLAVLFLLFGLPYLRNGGSPATTGGTSGSANLNVDLPGSGSVTGGASGQSSQ
jgi:hypothetical protein